MWWVCLYCLDFCHSPEVCPYCGVEFLEPVQAEDVWGVKSSHLEGIVIQLGHAEAK